MIRLFVGIDFESKTKDALASLCYGIPDMRWVSRQNLHLTLQFIGEVDIYSYDQIIERLRSSMSNQNFDPIKLDIKGVGYFAHARNQFTIWAAVEPNRQLLTLHKNIERTLSELMTDLKPSSIHDFKSELRQKKFKPHITLGRSDGPCRPEWIAEYLSTHASFVGPKVKFSEVTLFSSKLKPTGAVYQVEEVFPISEFNPQVFRESSI